MNSVSAQIQRAISDGISTQVLPQIQNVVMAGSGRGTRKGWDVSSERPELNSDQRNLNLQIRFLSFSQDVSHQEVISISPMRTSTLKRRSQRIRETLQLQILTPLPD